MVGLAGCDKLVSWKAVKKTVSGLMPLLTHACEVLYEKLCRVGHRGVKREDCV
jgi:hypothetical protein